MGKAKV
jgi:hypothetical protein